MEDIWTNDAAGAFYFNVIVDTFQTIVSFFLSFFNSFILSFTQLIVWHFRPHTYTFRKFYITLRSCVLVLILLVITEEKNGDEPQSAPCGVLPHYSGG